MTLLPASLRRQLRRGALAAAAAIALAGCGHVPDTTLRPDAPAISFAPVQDPFHGARLAVDPSTQAVTWQDTHQVSWLDPITENPQPPWLNGFPDLSSVRGYVAAAARQHALPVLVVYAIPNRGCSGFTEGLPYSDYDRPQPRTDSYHSFITELVATLGPTRAAIVLEPDAVPADCFDAARAATLKGAVEQLTAAKQYVYLDAGHPGWVPSGPVAQRLIDSGVAQAEGVSLNVSNRFPTEQVAQFGEELSELIGGRDYLVDSSRNGGSSSKTAGLAADWCNRVGQGLGSQATSSIDPTAYPHMAAQLWIKPPGESDGNNVVFPNQDCHGETAPPGAFSPRQARELIVNDPNQPAAVLREVAALTPDGSGG